VPPPGLSFSGYSYSPSCFYEIYKSQHVATTGEGQAALRECHLHHIVLVSLS